MNLTNIKKYLKEHLDKETYLHTLGCEKTAIKLAKMLGVDEEKARLSALLHDCAKHLSSDELVEYIKSNRIKINDPFIEKNKNLLHSVVSAHIARKKFKIKDKDVLRAVELHTIGGAGMSLLSKVIYLADVIEPTRDFNGVEKIRKLVDKDFNKALLEAIHIKIVFVLKKRKMLHPAVIEFYNEMVGL